MQKYSYRHFTDRLVVYAGGTIKHLLKRNEDYGKVRPLYVICVLDHLLYIPGESDEDRNKLVRKAQLKISGSEKVLSDKLNYVFLQLPVVKSLGDCRTFLEKWAWCVRNMVRAEGKPAELDGSYFDSLFEHSDRENIEKDKLSNYDTMIRDEIQIRAEKEFAVEQARAEALAKGREEGEVKGRIEGKAEIDRRCEPVQEEIERLCTIPGIDETGAKELIAEIGVNMEVFPTAANLASWSGVSPGNNESAGKKKART